MTKPHGAWTRWTVMAAIAVVTVGLYLHVLGLCLHTERVPLIVGTWSGDMTEVFTKIYGKYGIVIQDEKTEATFYRNGTYTSTDTFIMVAATGPMKGKRAKYVAYSKGSFVFRNGCGTLKEEVGKRTIDSRLIKVVILPDNVSLKLRDSSTLAVVESYGTEEQFQYCLKRKQP